MKYTSSKEKLLSLILPISAVIFLFLIISIGNSIANINKNNTTTTNVISTQVPEEEKKVQVEIPTANNSSTTNTTPSSTQATTESNSNSSVNQIANSEIVAGEEYTVKAGDTLFIIASKAYGESNTTAGIQKIKEENNLQNNNLSVGQKLKIPNL